MPIQTKRMYTGIIVNVDVDTVTLPNGLTVDLEVVRHPGAAAVVPLKDDGTVVLIRQFRQAAGGYIYEIPAGKLHPGEDPRVCAARELEEEIGYRTDKLELLSSIFTAPGFTTSAPSSRTGAARSPPASAARPRVIDLPRRTPYDGAASRRG